MAVALRLKAPQHLCRCVIDAAALVLLRMSLQQHLLVAVWRMATSRVAELEESSGGSTIPIEASDSVSLGNFCLQLRIDSRRVLRLGL
ncbi:hypothetical protein Y032_0028g1794 [Ancylostoma ceylanicum]|uniref:Uncharacterized protein n=1 Tax=Ancylostoma ceylanicum TaxID=53326 RepID=A0A016UTP1_9BILA|nr:hypothetical protein Y032_0028g1794 [Ancylostoma ceylanicum]